MLSTKALIAVAVALGVLVFTAPFHVLLLASFPLVMFQGNWSLSGVLVNTTDLVLGFLLLAYLVRPRPRADTRLSQLPYLLPWLALGLLLSLSYLTAPGTQEFLTSPIRIGYQLYRYSWKTILFFPLALLLLNDRVKMKHALFAIVLAGDLLALDGTIQGYSGWRGRGPFTTGNELAGALVIPFVLSLIGILAPKLGFRFFWIASSMLILRALLFTASRGSIVAITAGALFCGVWLLTLRMGRARVARLIPAALALGALLLWSKPDLLERPTISRAMTAREGLEASTMRWRMEERWPHFMEVISKNRWLGIGTAVDPELAKEARAPTPHSGYLAIAVAHGIPAGVLYAVLALLALRNGLRIFRRSGDQVEAAVGLLLAGALVGILVHNVVEATIRLPFVNDSFWLICALSARGALALRPERQGAKQSVPGQVLAPATLQAASQQRTT